jgi:hypothetical protein
MMTQKEGDVRRVRVVLKRGWHSMGNQSKAWVRFDVRTEVTDVQTFDERGYGPKWYHYCYEIDNAVPVPPKPGMWARLWSSLRRRPRLPEARLLERRV